MKHSQSCWKRKEIRNPVKVLSRYAAIIIVTQVAYSRSYIFSNNKLRKDKWSSKIRQENPSDFQTYSRSIDDLPDLPLLYFFFTFFFSDRDETFRVGAPNQKNNPPKNFLTLTLIQGHRVNKTENSQNIWL